jgi:hypothetical protein
MENVTPPEYRLYVDESGDHTFKDIEFLEKRYLGITGCIVQNAFYREILQPEFEKLKQKYFPHSPDDPLIFHRSEIINKKGRFWRLRDSEIEQNFNVDLLDFLNQMKYVVITVVIDKKAQVERYKESVFHPYHYCMGVLLERYCGFLKYHKTRGDVLAESRGGSEDRQLKIAYKTLYKNGTQFWPADFFQERLSSCEVKLKPKAANIAGTQVADLLAHPSKQDILSDNRIIPEFNDKFGSKIREVIQEKYNQHYGKKKVEGYGKIFLQ